MPSARSTAPLAVVEEGVEVVDQRLHLGGVAAGEAAVAAAAHRGEALAQPLEGRDAPPHLREPRQHQDHRDQHHRDGGDAVERGEDVQQGDRQDVGDADEPDRPEDRAEEEARAEGAHRRYGPAAMR